METNTEIYFYSLKNKFNYMSNFYKINFIDENNIQYNCSEQYFMYHKCKMFDPNNNKLLQNILSEKSPTKIKKYGRQVQNYDDNIWAKNRYNIMLQALRLKFNQNDIIKNKLINTKPKILLINPTFKCLFNTANKL
jgi:ribA/ribD-fused uncharacterized protein